MKRRLLLRGAPVLLFAPWLMGCSSSGGSGPDHDWDMDRRLAAIGEWAHVCAFEAGGLDPSAHPVSPIRGVDEGWGTNGRTRGSFYWPSRRTQIQITRPYEHVINIALHEYGHHVRRILTNGSTGGPESFANDINNACKESKQPDRYPAPPIDWTAGGAAPVLPDGRPPATEPDGE